MTDPKLAHGERRQYQDRRAESPKLREWVRGLSTFGKIAVAVAAALGSGAAVRGVTVAPPPPADVSALTARVTALEDQSKASAAILGGLARQSCLQSTEQQVVYSQIPCDSLMRGIGGWRTIRAETLRTLPRP